MNWPAKPVAICTDCPKKVATAIIEFVTGALAGEPARLSEPLTNELAGYRIVRHFGIVRGIVVRSRSVFGTVGASLQTLVGGNITIFTDLCEKTRQEAFDLLLQHAGERGANAIVAMRYDANDVMSGVTEVLAYGTAVQVEQVR